jgi:signal peptide peptidase SppA
VPFLDCLLRHEPLLIQPEILSAFIERCGSFSDTFRELFGEAPKPEIVSGVGIIPISGILGHRLMPIEKMLGAADVEDIGRTTEQFARDPLVHTLLFDIDSPGGTVTGIPELAELIASQSKPTAAFTSSMAASAAYWLGSRADRFFATPSASVGSVGVYLPLVDSSGAFAHAGLRMEVVKAGRLKAIGVPGTSLTDEQRSHLQERVDQIHAQFKASVREKRRYVRDEAMQGQTFYGAEALEKNLVSDLVSSRAAALSQLTPKA